jgi:hypothetical protein
VVFPPRLIIVLRNIAEGAEYTFKIMLVLESNVVLNECDTSRPSVVRYGCACHIHLQSRLLATNTYHRHRFRLLGEILMESRCPVIRKKDCAAHFQPLLLSFLSVGSSPTFPAHRRHVPTILCCRTKAAIFLAKKPSSRNPATISLTAVDSLV